MNELCDYFFFCNANYSHSLIQISFHHNDILQFQNITCRHYSSYKYIYTKHKLRTLSCIVSVLTVLTLKTIEAAQNLRVYCLVNDLTIVQICCVIEFL